MRIALVGSYNTLYIRSYLDCFLDDGRIESVIYINNSSIRHCEDDRIDTIINLFELNKRSNSIKAHLTRILNLQNNLLIRNLYSKIKMWLNNKKINKILLASEDLRKVDVYYFFWGDTLESEATLIKSIFPNSVRVLSVNTFPTDFRSVDGKMTKRERAYFRLFDGLVFPSRIMEDLLTKEKAILGCQKTIVVSDFIIQPPRKLLERSGKIEALIFLGNVDFSLRESDDISKLLVDMANNGFKISVQMGSSNIVHPNIKEFDPLTYNEIKSGSLAELIAKHDGVLYAYNSKGSLREKLSITTRFSLCEYANVPIVLEAHRYDAIEEEFENTCCIVSVDNLNSIKPEDIDTDLICDGDFSIDWSYRYAKLYDFFSEVMIR